ncbi:ribonuclease III [Coralloluteibacterium stylophorae]|uniref:Ribonuclease 3 n=1 Tax=Coralloluteibacterium stylophorae TaxID=1776034 RepID=A0A8J7VSN5_9GAMM|nr:ribonuclease III [Coralloluteibacterium stylophorae]MBS7458614.1 ribonuclease III [Coralloluteibacterium stylophorae]
MSDPRTSFGHAFSDAGLIEQALTHRSAAGRHNERLEFLGDALLNMIIAEALFARWPRADEGAMTRARAQLVREATLATLARGMDVGARLALGPGEMKSGGHRRDSILADALEAIIAAIYLDAGFDTCRRVVLDWYAPLLAELVVGKVEKDAKTRLQEWLQGRGRPLPVYSLVDAVGDEHDKVFHVLCELADPPDSAPGQGSSRRAAEQAAAAVLLARHEGRRKSGAGAGS